MNKKQFEAYLRERLSVLKISEINEIVDEYLQHIDFKIEGGASEEEAIADFGNMDDLVSDLLDAYKINQEPRDFKEFDYKAKLYLNKMMDFINSIAESLMKKSSSEIIGLIVQFILVLVIMMIFNGLLEIFARNLVRVFYFVPFFIGDILRAFINLAKVVIGASMSIGLLYWFAKERIIGEASEPVSKTVKAKTVLKEREVENQGLVKSDLIIDGEVVERVETEFVETDQKQGDDYPSSEEFQEEMERIQAKDNFGSKMRTFNLWVFRIIGFLILIPFIIMAVLSGIAYVTLLIATFSGYGSIGLSIVGSGFLLLFYAALIGLIKFIGGAK